MYFESLSSCLSLNPLKKTQEIKTGHSQRFKGINSLSSDTVVFSKLAKDSPILNLLSKEDLKKLYSNFLSEPVEKYVRELLLVNIPPVEGCKFGDVFFERYKTIINEYGKDIENITPKKIEDMLNALRKTASDLAGGDKALESNVKEYIANRAKFVAEQAKELNGVLKLPKNAVYLDMGCGDGKVASAIAEKLGIERVYGLEIDVRPEEDTGKLIRYGFDGANIPKRMPSPDFVTLDAVLHHTKNLDEAKKLLKSIFDKMNSGGYLRIREQGAGSVEEALEFQVRHLLSRIVSGVDPKELTPDVVYKSLDDWVKILEEIGFNVVNKENEERFGKKDYVIRLLVQKL